VERILTSLGFEVRKATEGWTVTVPSWRVDVAREVDLVEEIARHDGYERLPTTFPPLARFPGRPDLQLDRDKLASSTKSNKLEELSLEEGAIQFSQQELVYNACLQMGMKLLQPSLMDYLS
jgi:phenylalanyl-tRNA synthetase beta chain